VASMVDGMLLETLPPARREPFLHPVPSLGRQDSARTCGIATRGGSEWPVWPVSPR
jgi:hypothetical protein